MKTLKCCKVYARRQRTSKVYSYQIIITASVPPSPQALATLRLPLRPLPLRSLYSSPSRRLSSDSSTLPFTPFFFLLLGNCGGEWIAFIIFTRDLSRMKRKNRMSYVINATNLMIIERQVFISSAAATTNDNENNEE